MNAEDSRGVRHRSRSRVRVPVALPLGVVILLVGAGGFWLLDATISDRVSHGVEVRAVITEVGRYQTGKFGSPVLRLRVDYDVRGRRRNAVLMSMTSGDPHAKGESVTVYVSKSAANEVATGDGYASEDWLTQVPVALMAVGLASTASGVPSSVRSVRRRHDAPG